MVISRPWQTGWCAVIYFYHSAAMPLFLLDFYAKNEKSDLETHEKKQLRMIVPTILGKD